jgi:hypothetical protein
VFPRHADDTTVADRTARMLDGCLTKPSDPMKDAAKQLAVPLRETVKQEREPYLGPPSPSPGSFALPLSTRREPNATTPVPAQEY